ncbi:alpha/beta fold hydrolase [Noviherbaspirillum saxi]|uniref:Alpha/beta hydrolase n=1 Tax=Noviherbaspirillum saxi TaxID=2320863 RepID=A0A3A3G2B2_9BURK|nr:alpha/beta hydrolase [Noviherbaspirillum saxi]RJF95576.1 alpha/beta hydrolase [Noviherbaspirillum saxi]
MPYLDVPGARLRYDVSGDGRLLVFVHGAGANATVFFQQVAHFNRSYRVLCLDMRGFRGSHCDPERFHPRQFSDDLARVLDAEARGPAAVVCQSMGAWSGLPLAVREPERFAALVLSSSPTPAYGPHHTVLQQVSDRFGNVAAGKKVAPQDLGFTDKFVQERPDVLTLYQMLARMNQKLDLSKISDPELRLLPEHFVGYRVPTLVVGGLQNRLIGGETHLAAARCIPGAQDYTFTNSGHSSYFEEPDHFNRVVEQFISVHGHFSQTGEGGKPC